MAKKNSNPYSEFPKTSELVDRLLSTFPQYKNYTKDQFFSMLDKIAKAETQDSNIRQLEGGPGRGYYQMELTSAPYAYKRAININTSLKERNQPTIELPPYNQDFTKLSKDDQAFYVLSNMVGAAGAKREQGNPNAYLDPNRPKEMWINYHWAGKEKDKADRIKHWESVHGKSPKVIDKKVSKPVAKFQPNEIGIPIFTTKGDFIWDNTPAQIETALYGVGPTVQKANAVNQAAAVGTPLFDKGGLIKRKDGSYSRRGLWDNIRANRGSGRKPTAEMLRQERKIKAQKKEDGGWLDAYDDGGFVPGGSIQDRAIPTPTTPSYYPAYPDRTLTTRQMGTPKAPMYGPGGKVDLHLDKQNKYKKDSPRITPQGFLVRDPMGLFIGGAGFNYKANDNLNISPYAIGVGNEYFQKFPVDYGVNVNYPMGKLNPSVRIGKNPGIGVSYKFNNGGPVKYAAGATVWPAKNTQAQTSKTWSNATQTPSVNQANYVGSRAISPESAIPYPEVTYPKSARYFTQAPVMQGYNPYSGPMRLHAPDTTRMGDGGPTPSYAPYRTSSIVGVPQITQLTPAQEIAYQRYKQSLGDFGGDADYDLRGFWKEEGFKGLTDAGKNGVHFPDTYKILNLDSPYREYNTLSDESKYASEFDRRGQGYWTPIKEVPVDTKTEKIDEDWQYRPYKDGGAITNKYKKRVGIPYAISPGISNAGMYVGPTTQRGITFAQGGPIYNWIPNYPRVGAKYGMGGDIQLTKSQLTPAEVDSLILYKAYQFQKNNSSTGYKQWLDDIGKIYPGGPQALKKAREKNVGKLGTKIDNNKTSEFKPITPDSDYDKPYPGDLKIINYYKNLVGNSPNFRIGVHASPDLWHRTIKPIGSYYDGASSPIYAKPSFVNESATNPDIPYMPMRGMPQFLQEEATPKKVKVPAHTTIPPQYMDMRGEWSDTPPTAYPYTPEQLLKMGYRKSEPRKKQSGGWLDNL